MIASFEKVAGMQLKHKIVERRPGDIEQVWADTHLTNDILGWKAEYSIDDAIRTAWNWEKKNRNRM